MKKTFVLIAATLSAGAAFLAAPKEAHALGPVSGEAVVRLGYATDPTGGDSSSSSSSSNNPFGFGLGGRAGVSVLGFYFGGTIDYYFGASQSVTVPLVGTETVSTHTLMYGAQVGFNLSPVPLLTIRPQVSFGNADITGSTSGAVTSSADKNYFYIEGGVTGLVTFGSFIVGADVAVLDMPGADNSKASFIFRGQGGIKF